MRSIRFLAVATGALVFGSACGDGGDVGPNTPVSNFTVGTCTAGAPCQFTNTSTPAAGLTYLWTFGDANAPVADQTSALKDPTHTFSVAGDYTVSLKVTDASAATNTNTTTVTVAAGTNQLPVASFVLPTDCTAGTPCGFQSTSTDPDGTIATTDTDWAFGDTGVGEGYDATHTYTAAGTYTVTLTVTDNLGGIGTATQQLVVSPAASQDCTTTGTTVACSLTMTARVTVKILVVSEACELSGNDFYVTAPRFQTAFQNLCNRTPGQEYIVTDADGITPLVFTAGTPIALRFNQGPQGTNPPVSDPGIQITGSYPNWTLNIDDGGAAGTPGEPDFNDAVLSVQATLAP